MTQEAALLRVAGEIAKPASPLISTLLNPYVARLAKWTQNKETERLIGSDYLAPRIERYLRKLVKKASFVNTLVFPQREIPLVSVYEPLILTDNTLRKTIPAAALQASKLRACIIDGAGVGKTTYLKRLALDEVFTNRRIPVLFELRRLEPEMSLLEAVYREFDDLGDQFNRDLLCKLLRDWEFLLIFDGFDELPSKERKRVSGEIAALAERLENCSIIISSRPETDLPNIQSLHRCQFQELNASQAKAIALRFDAIAEIDVGARLIKEIDRVPEKFLTTPLLVALLYRTYGFNGSISEKVTTFYDELYNALYKGHDLSKAGFNREKESNLDFEAFRRLLRGLAFLSLTKHEISFRSETAAAATIDQAVALTEVTPESSSYFLRDLLLSVPLMARDGSELKYAHKTIAEYFAAEYLAFNPHADTLLAEIIASPISSSFGDALDFLSELDPSLFRRIVSKRLAEQVIAFEPHKDALYRTVLFFGSCYISLWVQSKVTKKRGDRTDLDIPPAPSNRSGMSFHYGKSRGVDYIIALSPANPPTNLADAALLDVSKPIAPPTRDHMDFKFSTLAMPRGKWLRIEDVYVDNAGKSWFTDILKNSLRFQLMRNWRKNGREVRVLDDEVAKSVLLRVEQESKRIDWIRSLISVKSRTTSLSGRRPPIGNDQQSGP